MSTQAVAPESATLLRDRQRLQSKVRTVTRVVTPIATVTLAAAVLFRSPPDFRTGLCVIVSLAAAAVVVRSLFTGKFVWTLPFLGVLGIFTPFHRAQFSHFVISILDMATLALLAVSPIIFEKSTRPLMLKHPATKV
jgi:predicted membrane channel-forming protein YqfA (hemolysin III family)